MSSKGKKSENSSLQVNQIQAAAVHATTSIQGASISVTGGINSQYYKAAAVTNMGTDANQVATASQYLGGSFRATAAITAGRNLVSPTAALLVAGAPGVAVGDNFTVTVNNTQANAQNRSLTGGAGVTIQGTAAVAQNVIGNFIGTFENVTGGAEVVTVTRIDV